MENYRIIKKLSGGSGGTVFKIFQLSDGAELVLKRVALMDLDEEARNSAKMEVDLMKQLNHPHIVPFYEAFLFNGEDLCIIMKYLSGGDLGTVLDTLKKGPNLSEQQVMLWFVQIALAIHYLHSHKIVHRDLKTGNVFLNSQTGEVMVGDFGVAKLLEHNHSSSTTSGTPLYMAPEILQGNFCSYKSDVWSLGCVLYELLCYRHPFEAHDISGLVIKVVRGEYQPIPGIYSRQMVRLVDRMLERDPRKRPLIDELLMSDYVRNAVHYYMTVRVPQGPPDNPGEAMLDRQMATLGVSKSVVQIQVEKLSKNELSSPVLIPHSHKEHQFQHAHHQHHHEMMAHEQESLQSSWTREWASGPSAAYHHQRQQHPPALNTAEPQSILKNNNVVPLPDNSRGAVAMVDSDVPTLNTNLSHFMHDASEVGYGYHPLPAQRQAWQQHLGGFHRGPPNDEVVAQQGGNVPFDDDVETSAQFQASGSSGMLGGRLMHSNRLGYSKLQQQPPEDRKMVEYMRLQATPEKQVYNSQYHPSGYYEGGIGVGGMQTPPPAPTWLEPSPLRSSPQAWGVESQQQSLGPRFEYNPLPLVNNSNQPASKFNDQQQPTFSLHSPPEIKKKNKNNNNVVAKMQPQFGRRSQGGGRKTLQEKEEEVQIAPYADRSDRNQIRRSRSHGHENDKNSEEIRLSRDELNLRNKQRERTLYEMCRERDDQFLKVRSMKQNNIYGHINNQNIQQRVESLTALQGAGTSPSRSAYDSHYSTAGYKPGGGGSHYDRLLAPYQ